MHECTQYILCLPLVSASIWFQVKHANVGLRLRKGVPAIRLPPNAIQIRKYWLCVPCTHWHTLTIYIFKGEFINSWFALILHLFADSVCSAHRWNRGIMFTRHHSYELAAECWHIKKSSAKIEMPHNIFYRFMLQLFIFRESLPCDAQCFLSTFSPHLKIYSSTTFSNTGSLLALLESCCANILQHKLLKYFLSQKFWEFQICLQW